MDGEAQINAAIYESPDPKKVWVIARDYGLHVAFARWSWMPKQAVGRLAERGRALTEGGRRPGNTRRTISEAVEKEIVEAVFPLLGVRRRALRWAFHDQRQRDPPDELSGRVLHIDGKVAPVPVRHFVLHNLGQGSLSLFLGRFKVVQVQPFTVGREGLAIMDVEEEARHGDSLPESIPTNLGWCGLFVRMGVLRS